MRISAVTRLHFLARDDDFRYCVRRIAVPPCLWRRRAIDARQLFDRRAGEKRPAPAAVAQHHLRPPTSTTVPFDAVGGHVAVSGFTHRFNASPATIERDLRLREAIPRGSDELSCAVADGLRARHVEKIAIL